MCWSLVESMRTARGPQLRVLVGLGELNGIGEKAWRRAISVLRGDGPAGQIEPFPSDSDVLPESERVAPVVLSRERRERPRDFGPRFAAHRLWMLPGIGPRMLPETRLLVPAPHIE